MWIIVDINTTALSTIHPNNGAKCSKNRAVWSNYHDS
jgi:hypothetical protein